jgi:hypothetical protein
MPSIFRARYLRGNLVTLQGPRTHFIDVHFTLYRFTCWSTWSNNFQLTLCVSPRSSLVEHHRPSSGSHYHSYLHRVCSAPRRTLRSVLMNIYLQSKISPSFLKLGHFSPSLRTSSCLLHRDSTTLLIILMPDLRSKVTGSFEPSLANFRLCPESVITKKNTIPTPFR